MTEHDPSGVPGSSDGQQLEHLQFVDENGNLTGVEILEPAKEGGVSQRTYEEMLKDQITTGAKKLLEELHLPANTTQPATVDGQNSDLIINVADQKRSRQELELELKQEAQRKIDELLMNHPSIGQTVGVGENRVLIFSATETGVTNTVNGFGQPLEGTTTNYLLLTSWGFRVLSFDRINVMGIDVQDRYHEHSIHNFQKKLESIQQSRERFLNKHIEDLNKEGSGISREAMSDEDVLSQWQRHDEIFCRLDGFFIDPRNGGEILRIDGQDSVAIDQFLSKTEKGVTSQIMRIDDTDRVLNIIERSKNLPVLPTPTVEEINHQLGILDMI